MTRASPPSPPPPRTSPRPAPRWLRWRQAAGPLALAWLAASLWGSVLQTQVNLQALAALGVEIPTRVRAITTLQDLAGFAPLYAGIVAAAWLPALALAAWVGRRWPPARLAGFAAAGGLGLMAAVRSIDALAPMPVFIDATRHLPVLLAMAAGSAAASAWWAWRTRPQGRPR